MYKGKMYCADFEENTITIEVEGEFLVRAGDYVLLSIEEYEELSKLHQPTVISSVCNHPCCIELGVFDLPLGSEWYCKEHYKQTDL